jgi:hypothetical protein
MSPNSRSCTVYKFLFGPATSHSIDPILAFLYWGYVTGY